MAVALSNLDFDAPGEWLLGVFDSPHFAPVAFVVAFLAGALHAVGPGHGKTLAAAYLAGSHARVRDAAWLSFSVAAMHTVSVLVIAVAWTFLSLSDLVRLDRLTAGLQLVAGLLVVSVGVWLLHRRRRGHHHHHHHHADEPERPQTRRPGAVLLGLSGGLIPSPAAFLVLTTGLFSGRSGLALALVLVFGAGLALVLFTVGLLALGGRAFVFRALGSGALVTRAAALAPLLAAGAITAAGCAITSFAVMDLVTTV